MNRGALKTTCFGAAQVDGEGDTKRVYFDSSQSSPGRGGRGGGGGFFLLCPCFFRTFFPLNFSSGALLFQPSVFSSL